MDHDDYVYLVHILECIDKIEKYTTDKSTEDFMGSTMVQDAVIRKLEIIGEAANHISKGFLKSNPQVNWGIIISTRNKLIHDYFIVDTGLVWTTVQRDIPILKKEIIRILENYKS